MERGKILAVGKEIPVSKNCGVYDAKGKLAGPGFVDLHCHAGGDCFAYEDPVKMAAWDDAKIESLLRDPGIIRNRLKIQAARSNARCFLALCEERGSFSDYLWSFVGATVRAGAPASVADYRGSSPESDALSRDLKRRGFRFVGSTVMYAHMQATGMVNDHSRDCFRRLQLSDAHA